MAHSVVNGRMKAIDNEERKIVVKMKIVKAVACKFDFENKNLLTAQN